MSRRSSSGGVEHAADQNRQQPKLAQERRRAPGPQHGHPHRAVAQRHRNVVFLRDLGGLQQLDARRHAQLPSQPLLVGSQNQVGQQRAELALANDFLEVEVFPAVARRQCRIALRVQLDAHAIRLLLADHLPHQVGGFLGNMRRAHQQERAPLAFHDSHVRRVWLRIERCRIGQDERFRWRFRERAAMAWAERRGTVLVIGMTTDPCTSPDRHFKDFGLLPCGRGKG